MQFRERKVAFVIMCQKKSLENTSKRESPIFIDYNSLPYSLTPSNTGIVNPSLTPTMRFTGIEFQGPSVLTIPEINFKELGIGGLDAEAGELFRRAFASRMLSEEILERLGIQHIKGILLHGPPGTGKTLIVRKLASILGNVEVKVIHISTNLVLHVGIFQETIDAIAKSKDYGIDSASTKGYIRSLRSPYCKKISQGTLKCSDVGIYQPFLCSATGTLD